MSVNRHTLSNIIRDLKSRLDAILLPFPVYCGLSPQTLYYVNVGGVGGSEPCFPPQSATRERAQRRQASESPAPVLQWYWSRPRELCVGIRPVWQLDNELIYFSLFLSNKIKRR